MTDNSTLLVNSRPIDLICMGRVAVDLYAEQVHSPLEDAQSFRKYLGGCAGNTAVGTSRLGLKSAMFSCVGTDNMGVYIRKTLESEGVNTTLLKDTPDHLTALVLLGVNPPEHFPLIFYRENCADMQIKIEDIKPEIFKQTKALLITGTGISTPAMRETTMESVKMAKSCGCAVILDIDFRPVLWGLTEAGDGETRFVASKNVTNEIQLFLPELDLIVGTEEEIQICAGISSKNVSEKLEGCISTILKKSPATIVLKKGRDGCEIYTSNSSTPISSRSFKIEVLNVLGAGDAFMSGFLRGWLREQTLETCALYGNACGALVVTRHGCSPSSPSFEEMHYFIRNFDKIEDLAHHPKMNQMHLRTELGLPQKKDMLILAVDHRIQFEKSCRQKGVSLNHISVFKEHVFKGFKNVVKSNKNKELAILIDTEYGQNILENSNYAEYSIGVPIEKSDSLKLDWLTDRSLYQHLLERPDSWFVKVPCHYNLKMSSNQKKELFTKLRKLHDVCVSLKRKLLIELIILDDSKKYFFPLDQDNPKLNGKTLGDLICELYKTGVNPYWWGISVLDNEKDWKKMTKKIDQFDKEVGIIVLGGQIPIEKFQTLFSLGNSTPHNCGFMIGTSLFWETWEKFINEKIKKSDIAELISSRYQFIIDTWYKNKKT